MENWLVRSNMNGQRPQFAEKKDSLQPSTSSTSISRLQRPMRYSQKIHARRLNYRESVRSMVEACQDSECRLSKSKYWVDLEVSNSLQPSEGYLLTSSQIQLLPGCSLNEQYSLPSWEMVAQTKCLLEEDVICPICLYPPVLPRMERCGHIYCGPCVVQYINFDNEGHSKKCAVCSWTLRIGDLKRVFVKRVSTIKVGSTVEMVLIKRLTFNDRVGPKFCLSTDNNSDIFQFVLRMSAAELMAYDSEELETLRTYKMTCQEDGTTELLPAINCLLDDLHENLNNSGQTVRTNKMVSDDSLSRNEHISETSFYQEINGRPIFLDGLMWKCLLTEYTAHSNLPNPLTAIVTEIHSCKMSPAMQKRWRHLSHLPMGHTFSLVEIDLNTHVSEATLAQFSTPLSCRAAEQTRRHLEDLRLTRLKEDAENRIPLVPVGFTLSGHASLATGDQHHRFDPSEFVPLVDSTYSEAKNLGSRSSFADVTKAGALSVLDHKRVATFGRVGTRRSDGETFNPALEAWPTLDGSGHSQQRGGIDDSCENRRGTSIWFSRSLFGGGSPPTATNTQSSSSKIVSPAVRNSTNITSSSMKNTNIKH